MEKWGIKLSQLSPQLKLKLTLLDPGFWILVETRGWGGGGWLEKWGIKLSHLSTEVEVEAEDELGNYKQSSE